MTVVIDWQSVPDANAVIRDVATALTAGQLVVLPTEAGYVLAADGRSVAAMARLRGLLPGGTDTWSHAVSSESAAREWLPRLGPLGRRLLRRVWPGPVTLTFSNLTAEQLPKTLQGRVDAAAAISLRSPAHEVLRGVLRLLPDSLVLADVPPIVTAEPTTGTRLAAALGERVDWVIDDGAVRFPEGATVVNVAGERWQVLREGAVATDLIERQTVCVIVFVCTGNTCRSPMAEGLCKKRLSDRLGCSPEELPQRGFVVLSAGLSAYSGGSAAPEAIAVASNYGADLSGHRSRGMTAELLFQADHVLGMTRDHVEALAEASAGLTQLPRLLSSTGADLTDPVGHDHAVYEECAAAIWKHLETLTAEFLGSAHAAPVVP